MNYNGGQIKKSNHNENWLFGDKRLSEENNIYGIEKDTNETFENFKVCFHLV